METMDQNTQQQVWQRVLQQPMEQPPSDLRAMLMAAAELAAIYRHLTGIFTGKARERTKQLWEGEQANFACLKGLGILSGQGDEVLRIWNPTREAPRKLLEKCYHRTRRCMVDYMGRSAEPEFGIVFRSLADREGRHCVILAELLGMKTNP